MTPVAGGFWGFWGSSSRKSFTRWNSGEWRDICRNGPGQARKSKKTDILTCSRNNNGAGKINAPMRKEVLCPHGRDAHAPCAFASQALSLQVRMSASASQGASYPCEARFLKADGDVGPTSRFVFAAHRISPQVRMSETRLSGAVFCAKTPAGHRAGLRQESISGCRPALLPTEHRCGSDPR